MAILTLILMFFISLTCSMVAPINCVPLSDLSFYLDERLKHVNVYQFTFVSPDIDDIIADIVQMSQKFSCVQMIQETSLDYAKLTFVSHVSCHFFYQYVDKLLVSVCQLHHTKCTII